MAQDNILQEKSLQFAAMIVKLHMFLCKEKHETVISKQIIRSGTSIGANINEATYGSSKADFIAKLHVALKETAETEYWLRLLTLSYYLNRRNDIMGAGGLPSGGVVKVNSEHQGLPRKTEHINSRYDLYGGGRRKQSRWYDANGIVVRNRDYFHTDNKGNHTFPKEIQQEYDHIDEFRDKANIDGRLLKDIWDEVAHPCFMYCGGEHDYDHPPED